ncbi:hypothetical protein QKQ66_gp020 [Dione juno nucleopolyhedrovirus]|uniref:Uncharacterized protein n=1 Tax=Dione juno nucleopolyhedrovirus TaxID=2594175 RepID=A0AAF1D9X6_9ABAC|nr:hypothetical protein QKQ66_gp020 [Dione juno nucleopolyhedrovirus]QDL56937.1 hypothetical protein DijuNPV-ORF-20 [Dione juno nucleopolyhedrovirus]
MSAQCMCANIKLKSIILPYESPKFSKITLDQWVPFIMLLDAAYIVCTKRACAILANIFLCHIKLRDRTPTRRLSH